MCRRRRRKENGAFCTSRAGIIKLLLMPNWSNIKYKFLDSVVILRIETINQWIYQCNKVASVRVFTYKCHCYVWNTHGGHCVFECMWVSFTFLGCTTPYHLSWLDKLNTRYKICSTWFLVTVSFVRAVVSNRKVIMNQSASIIKMSGCLHTEGLKEG